MSFHSLEYAIFLVVVFLVYWGLSRFNMFRIVWLLLASWVFYAASNPWFLLLILASTVTDYFAATQMDKARDDHRVRKRWLWISLFLNLGLLGYWKYTNFFLESGVAVANLFGADLTFTRLDILLPAGISFYTFQTMSYSIDVYRGRLKPERDFLRFALFVGYFPQLVAGPIVRAVDFLPQLHRKPKFSKQQASRAMWLIGVGIFKKVAIADYLGVNLVERVFDTPDLISSMDVLLGLYAYTMQIYMDFSAYTDIAIGSALLFGFHLPDNFDRPYLAHSVQDFWRRWHKTLGSWLRDYIYYPLGGGRGTPYKAYRNLFITFLLIGLWHGADWTYVVYGSGHATAMCLNRFFRKRRERLGKPANPTGLKLVWGIFFTFHFVVLMRVLFRAGSYTYDPDVDPWGKAGDVLAALSVGTFDVITVMTPMLWGMLLVTFAVHWSPRRYVEASFVAYRRLPMVAQGMVLGAVLLLAMHLSTGQPLPFAYFKF